MSLTIILRCDECGAHIEPRVWFKLTKMSVFRLEGSSDGFYIDGGSVLCRAHQPYPLPAPQAETWTESDRRAVEEFGP